MFNVIEVWKFSEEDRINGYISPKQKKAVLLKKYI